MKKIKISEKELIQKIRNQIMETTTASAGSVEKPLNEDDKPNPEYTHFAVDTNDNKIIFGWEYKNLDPQSIKEYCKSDLLDMDVNLREVKVYGKNKLKQMGIDPLTYDSWKNLSEDVFLNEKLKGNQVKLDKDKDGKITGNDFKMLRKGGKKLNEEMEKLISEKNFTIIKNKIDSLGSRQAGKFLIDYFIGRILGGLSSSDLPDTALFADGLDELEDMLIPDLTIEDATRAFIYAKDIANQMIEEEGGGLFGESEDLYESTFETQDPTKKEMLNYLSNEVGGFEGYDEFSAEEAIYWYAYNNHGGQNSNLYSALSTSKFKPSRLHKNIDDSDDEMSLTMYNMLVEKFGGEEISNGYEEDLYESKKQILNNDKLMDKEINEMMKTTQGRKKLKNAVRKLDEEKSKTKLK